MSSSIKTSYFDASLLGCLILSLTLGYECTLAQSTNKDNVKVVKLPKVETDDYKLPEIGGPEKFTAKGQWKFESGVVWEFTGQFAGAIKDERQNVVGKWDWTNPTEPGGRNISIYLGQAPLICTYKDFRFLSCVRENGRVIAWRTDYAPKERSASIVIRSLAAPPESIRPRLAVNLDFLKLERCLQNPWTNDPEQAIACWLMPIEEIWRRRGKFDGGENPDVRRISQKMKSYEARCSQETERCEKEFSKSLNYYSRIDEKTTTTVSREQSLGAVSKRTSNSESGPGSGFAGMLARSVTNSKYAEKMDRLEAELQHSYIASARQLAELAPLMYAPELQSTHLISVKIGSDGFEFENDCGFDLTNLTVRVDIYDSKGQLYDFRLFASQKLHPTEKRFASAQLLKFAPGTNADSVPIPKSPADRHSITAGSKDFSLKVSAWAREARQDVEFVSQGK